LQWIATSKTGFGNGTYSNKECVEWLNGKYPGDTSIQEISGYQIKKFADKTTKAFELITGVNYHKLSRERKEIVRHKYIDFAESQKRIFNEYIWVNALFASWHKDHSVKWIITDLRFENEAEFIKKRGGIVIRVNRDRFSYKSDLPESASPIEHAEKGKELHYHPSETSLDDYEFDYVIDNNGSIEELVEKVKQLNLV